MNFYKKLNNFLLVTFVILYPILPTYGTFSSDIILYLLVLLNVVGFLFFEKERRNFKRSFKSFSNDKMLTSLVLLNLTMYISAFVAIDKRIVITNSIRFSLYIFIFYLISYTVKTKKQIFTILNAFVFTAVLSSIVTIIQTLSIATSGNSIDNAHRVSSFLENSNNLGAYTILSIFIVIMFMIKSTRKSTKVFFGFISLLLFINIISSQSRNALIGLFIGSLLVAILYDKRFIILSVILPIILLIIPQSRLRILQIFDPAQNVSRFKIWESAKMMIHDNPLFGIGYENFQINYPIYVSNNKEALTVWDGFRTLHPHNIFLKMQTELGILGTIAFMFFIAITIITLLTLIRNNRNNHVSTILIGITSGFVALQFMNLIDNFYGAPKVLLSMIIVLGISNYYK
ncbi:MAG: O-antigen ligase family protein, partial [Clostridium sp.]